tara:strand:- start:817 stop:1200 length:384 start_codon:yes stop_codon:yes gene_type:complete
MEALHELFDDTYDEVMALPDTPHAGLAYWRKKKLWLSSIPITNLEWVNVDESFDPHDSKNEFYIDDDGLTIATPLHFTNQLKRIPLINVPSERKIVQMALNAAQAVRSGEHKAFIFSTFSNIVRLKS